MTTELQVADRVIARLAGYAASVTPGVARLQPTVSRRVARGAVGLARRGFTRGAAEHSLEVDAVEIERSDSVTLATLRIVATGQPTVLETVAAVQQAVSETVALHTGAGIEVTVIVVDVDSEPADTPPA